MFRSFQVSLPGSPGAGIVNLRHRAFDDATLDELWKINVGSPFAAPPMTFEFNGKQYLAIASGRSPLAKRRADNIPELKEQRNATVLYVFGL